MLYVTSDNEFVNSLIKRWGRIVVTRRRLKSKHVFEPVAILHGHIIAVTACLTLTYVIEFGTLGVDIGISVAKSTNPPTHVFEFGAVPRGSHIM